MKVVFILSMALLCASCGSNNDSGGPSGSGETVGTFDASRMTFHSLSYDQKKYESFTIGNATASLYRNPTDGEMKMGLGFSEFSLSSDPCEDHYLDPSDKNPKQRIFTIYNLSLLAGTNQKLVQPPPDLMKETTPGGRVVAFGYEAPPEVHYHLGAQGEVTILKLSDKEVTVKIDSFVSTGEIPFAMNGIAVLPICIR